MYVVFQDISKDPNAEKLVSRYHPQIALTSQSLFTLLNNHGPNYKEQWEIPVCIQVIPVAGLWFAILSNALKRGVGTVLSAI